MEKTRNPGVAASAIPTEVTVSFVNKTEAPIALYWDSGSGQPTKFAEIQTGASYSVHTYAGQRWIARGGNGHELLTFTPTGLLKTAQVDITPN